MGGRSPGCVTCLEAAGCDTAAFGAGSCTGFVAPAVAVKVVATQCTDADTTKWNGDAGHATWQSQMTSCGTKCLGKASCVTTCMQGDGWTTGCSGCFGDLAGCTASHCLVKCMGGRSPGCVTCLEAAGCDTAAFGAGSCTGFVAPTVAVKAVATQCTDADTTKWNGDAGHATWQSQMTSCGTTCLGKASCVTTCMQGAGWSNGCSGCFGDLAGCTASHCLVKCMGGRSPGCVTCLKDAGCDTAAFGAGSCTGFVEPSMAQAQAFDVVVV